MKIKANHFYRTRAGAIVGPVSLTDNHWFWNSPQRPGDYWYAARNPSYGKYDGKICSTDEQHPDDLVWEIDLFDMRIPFMFLDDDIQAFLETTEAPLEILTDNGWEPTSKIVYPNLVYRVAKPNIRMTIPWDVIRPEFRYAAKDKNGGIWVYPEKPENRKNVWFGKGTPMKIDKLLIGVDPGTAPWDRSLQERPA